MAWSWNILMRAGLPDGAIRPQESIELKPSEAREAVAELAAGLDSLPQRERELLLAWLSAWQHHWPSSFDHALGSLGDTTIERLRRLPYDPNRYLKLRRIAIANLSHVRLPVS